VNTKSGDPMITTNVTTGIFDRPTLGYGMFHANAQPNKLFGLVSTGVSFKGVLMDIGHVRHMRWVKDTGAPLDSNFQPLRQNPADANSPIITDGVDYARKRWVAYNKMRGQYSSALEHAVPERFFNNTSQCSPPQTIPSNSEFDPMKPLCAEGVSAAKVLYTAQQQGQKIFVISQENASIAIPQISHRSSVIDEVRSAVAAGKVVTIHQSTISLHGWSGTGYSVLDPDTGAGGYLIEGGARGAFFIVGFIGILLSLLSVALDIILIPTFGLGLLIGGLIASFNNAIQNYYKLTDFEKLIIGAAEIIAALAVVGVCVIVCTAAAASAAVGGVFMAALVFVGNSVGCYVYKNLPWCGLFG
jgi:hypothetical protein